MERLDVVEQVTTCTNCTLVDQCTAPVSFTGVARAQVAVIGEAPGGEEDRKGRPFCGSAGKWLRTRLRDVGIDDEELAYMNVVSCLPHGTPKMEHIEACAHNRVAQLDYLDPQWVLLVGGVALSAWRPDLKVSQTHGRPMLLDGKVAFSCVDASTEALTPSGWRNHDELRDGDVIAAFDPLLGVLQWESGTFHRQVHSGDMVVIDNPTTSQWLTPDHRCWTQHWGNNPWVGVTSADKLNTHSVLPLAARMVDGGTSIGADLARLAGWYLAEGTIKSRTAIAIYQSERANPDNVREIRRLLDSVGAQYVEYSPKRNASEIVFSITGDVARELKALVPDKKMTLQLANLPLHEAEAFLQAFVAGDGHTTPGGLRVIYQKDVRTVDLLQMVASRLGIHAIKRPFRNLWTLTLRSRSWYRLDGDGGRISRQPYEGVVWCPSVPSGYWLARRSGKPFLTGNCFHPSAAMRRTSFDRDLRCDLARFKEMLDAGKENWVKFIPDECAGVKCRNFAVWLDDFALGWCEKHIPVEGAARLEAVENEYRRLAGKPLVRNASMPTPTTITNAEGTFKLKCECPYHPDKGHEAVSIR